MPWDLTGNAGTNSVINPAGGLNPAGTAFLGTTDFQPLAIETNAPGIGNRPSIVVLASNAPDMPRGFVGIGMENPRTQLHVEFDSDIRVPTVHTSGPNAAYSFSYSPGLPPNRSATSGERWQWKAAPGSPTSPTTDPPRASLQSFNDKLIVTSFGQVLLPGRTVAGVQNFPSVPIGTPTSSPEPGELVLGATRTSIRGFDGLPQNPAAPGGMHLGNHWIRTNGNDLEWWIGFQRGGSFSPPFTAFPYRMFATVDWHAPNFIVTSSDERLKTNVRQVEGALEKLERIRGVAFESAETESRYALGGVPGQARIGVVAQEVEEVFPEVVSIYDVASAGPDQDDTDQEDKEEYKAVDYNGLTGVLIEAVKELKAQNEALRSRIEALERAQE